MCSIDKEVSAHQKLNMSHCPANMISKPSELILLQSE